MQENYLSFAAFCLTSPCPIHFDQEYIRDDTNMFGTLLVPAPTPPTSDRPPSSAAMDVLLRVQERNATLDLGQKAP